MRPIEALAAKSRFGKIPSPFQATLAALAILFLPQASWACPSPGPIEIVFCTVVGSAILAAVASIPVCLVLSFAAGRFSRKAPSQNSVFLCFSFLLAPVVFLSVATSGGGAYACAEASNMISDLRNMKAATMMYLADHPESADSEATAQNLVGLIAPYMDNPGKMDPARFALYIASPHTWWVGCRTDNVDGEDTTAKLERRAKSTGLYGSPQLDMPPLSIHDRYYRVGDGAVWMLARKPHDVDSTPLYAPTTERSDIDTPTEQNGTPLDMALSLDHKSIAQYLKGLGAETKGR